MAFRGLLIILCCILHVLFARYLNERSCFRSGSRIKCFRINKSPDFDSAFVHGVTFLDLRGCALSSIASLDNKLSTWPDLEVVDLRFQVAFFNCTITKPFNFAIKTDCFTDTSTRMPSTPTYTPTYTPTVTKNMQTTTTTDMLRATTRRKRVTRPPARTKTTGIVTSTVTSFHTTTTQMPTSTPTQEPTLIAKSMPTTTSADMFRAITRRKRVTAPPARAKTRVTATSTVTSIQTTTTPTPTYTPTHEPTTLIPVTRKSMPTTTTADMFRATTRRKRVTRVTARVKTASTGASTVTSTVTSRQTSTTPTHEPTLKTAKPTGNESKMGLVTILLFTVVAIFGTVIGLLLLYILSLKIKQRQWFGLKSPILRKFKLSDESSSDDPSIEIFNMDETAPATLELRSRTIPRRQRPTKPKRQRRGERKGHIESKV